MTTHWWGTPENVSKRFVAEYKAMKEQFKDRANFEVDQEGILTWTIRVNVGLAEIPKEQREHTIRIVCDSNYPNAAPAAFCDDIETSRHMYGSNKLCLFNPSEGTNHGWNPSRSTALTVALWSTQWLYAHYTWKVTGRWPGDEHNVSGDRLQTEQNPEIAIRRNDRLEVIKRKMNEITRKDKDNAGQSEDT
jgi:ubiquitin-protein ligase